MQESIQQIYCRSEARFIAGGKLRDEAVALERARRKVGRFDAAAMATVDDLHRKANIEFEAAASCGHVRAMVALANGHCYGFAVPVNRPKGLGLLREAARKDAGVAIEFLSSNVMQINCPVFKEKQ